MDAEVQALIKRIASRFSIYGAHARFPSCRLAGEICPDSFYNIEHHKHAVDTRFELKIGVNLAQRTYEMTSLSDGNRRV